MKYCALMFSQDLLRSRAMKVSIKKYISAAMFTVGMIGVQSAHASFVMMLDDPNDSNAASFITDLSASDFNPVTGAITYVGSIGAFIVNVVTGVSKPTIGPSQLDINSINVTGNTAGTLLVGISDTGFSNMPSGFLASYGGTTQGSVKFNYLYSATNTEFSGNSFASGTFNSTLSNVAFSNDISSTLSGVAPFSLSILAEITHTSAHQVTSFDASINPLVSPSSEPGPSPVPLPAALWLFASALMGGAFTTRLKK